MDIKQCRLPQVGYGGCPPDDKRSIHVLPDCGGDSLTNLYSPNSLSVTFTSLGTVLHMVYKRMLPFVKIFQVG